MNLILADHVGQRQTQLGGAHCPSHGQEHLAAALQKLHITFRSIHQLLRSQGVALHISGMKLPVEAVLRRSGDLAEGPSLRLYRTDVEALAALQTIEPIHPETTP